MIGAERERAGQFGFPCGHRLAGPRIDQVKTDARKMLLRRRDRTPRLVFAVRATKKLKDLRVKALHADRNAIDPRGGKIGEIGNFHRIGVGFQRDLDIVAESPLRVRRRNHRRHSRGRHQAGRTATKEDRTDAAPRQQPRLMPQVRQERVKPCLLYTSRCV